MEIAKKWVAGPKIACVPADIEIRVLKELIPKKDLKDRRSGLFLAVSKYKSFPRFFDFA